MSDEQINVLLKSLPLEQYISLSDAVDAADFNQINIILKDNNFAPVEESKDTTITKEIPMRQKKTSIKNKFISRRN